ncbi:SDR family NAD(P)-dependent oxidoreductase [Thalassotalea crassostreae]|uniref:SDR family NAD(P)-dependent oxidoreductase n=1 Tax=Thalassotalea crassostreae TaxID=1763536 RepID=UPI0008390DC9|nr:SDR family oxidoreductase [Thalassotalea crassostreae]
MKKVCLVTGGSSGIGLAIVQSFLTEGYEVFNLDLQPSAHGHFIECNMTQTSQVADAIKAIIQQTGQIDVLICNAGIHCSANIVDTSETLFDNVFAVNVKGAFAATKAVIPAMQNQKAGSIIYIASDQSVIAKTNSFAYNISKHALASMAKTTALDFAKDNIRANAICPGTIETPLYHNAIDKYCRDSGRDKAEVNREEAALQPINRLGQPDEVAAFALFLASDEASFITGSLQMIDGGYTAG